LIVWQKAMALAAEVYGLTRKLPAEERGALGGGLRHAAVAVPCLVAEGQGRGNGVEFAERLRAARGKLAELDTLLLLGVELGHFRDAEIENATALMTDVRRLLQKFIQRLQGEAQD
jgi:four helix bundle protein